MCNILSANPKYDENANVLHNNMYIWQIEVQLQMLKYVFRDEINNELKSR